jgi:hypothetical protein
MNPTENERIWQWLNSHTEEILDYLATKTKDVSEVETVAFDADRHAGVLAVFSYQGVTKVVSITPTSLLEGFTGLDEEIRQLCQSAAQTANTAAAAADEKGDYAKQQGDRVVLVLGDLDALKTAVRNQGDEAEGKGIYAYQQALMAKEISDYPPVWHDGFLWVYDATASDPVLGKRRKTGTTAVDFTTLSEEVKNEMFASFIRSNNAPSIVGSTLLFPAVSTARIVNSTLII